jgi:hypothetical protein
LGAIALCVKPDEFPSVPAREVPVPYPYKSIREWFADEEKLGNVVRIDTPIKCGDYSNLVDIGFADYNNVPDPRNVRRGSS